MANAENTWCYGLYSCSSARSNDGGWSYQRQHRHDVWFSQFFCPRGVATGCRTCPSFYDEFYGQDLAIGTGYIDAKYPGAQALSEKTFKMLAAASQQRFNFPVGLLAGGKRFSPEQAVLELEVAETIKRYARGFEVNDETLALQVIHEVGIGKEYFSHEHTLLNFQANLWIPELADRSLPCCTSNEKERDMVHAAHEKVKKIIDSPDLYVIDDVRAKAIDEIVEKAKKILIEK